MTNVLKSLAEADPFTPFSIAMTSGSSYAVEKKGDLEFTPSGIPKVTGDWGWALLNPDAITSITAACVGKMGNIYRDEDTHRRI